MSSQQASAIKQQTKLVNVNITPDHNTNIQSPTEDNVFLQQHTTISPQLCERPRQKQQQPTKS